MLYHKILTDAETSWLSLSVDEFMSQIDENNIIGSMTYKAKLYLYWNNVIKPNLEKSRETFSTDFFPFNFVIDYNNN